MSILGFKARNHPQQVTVAGANPLVDDREVTDEVWQPFDRRFRFTIDVAAASHNAKCARYFDASIDGLGQPWTGERVWCNPPYSSIRPWVDKAWRESSRAVVIVLLVPANRTEQRWWQELVEPYRDRGPGLRTEFLPGRLRFLAPGQGYIRPNERPPFGSVLLVWEGQPDVRPTEEARLL